jgi:hypothetical protein
VRPLPFSYKRFDDLERGAGLTLGPHAFEIRGKFLVGAKDFLVAHLLVGALWTGDAPFQ